ncbi:MAG TPA: type II toxin-antitoxin system VapC family toxin [Methylomirabilota bacterium]|nr:type II toxin-antitoxin system VapC family toxin [Methylomirabilota bacterium]
MKIYLDTSALVKLYVDEEGSATVREALGPLTLAVTSAIAYLEARAALARRRREGGLAVAAYRGTVRALEADWQQYMVVQVHEALIRDAARLAEARRLRAYDALHLASARLIRRRLGPPIVFACWDRELERVARAEGFRVLAWAH